MKSRIRTLLLAGLFVTGITHAAGPDLLRGFTRPPPSARPWVYWFWLNGNITRPGITADLEAMKRAGIGGVLIMEVDQGAPLGPVGFMSPAWRELFKHVVAEAQRLGLEVNMNNDAGWNGSGGPWIQPEQSMQKVVWTETNVAGPHRFEAQLAKPAAVAGFYRDLAVLAFPSVGAYRIENIKVKAGYEVGGVGGIPATNLPPGMIIDRRQIMTLTPQMDPAGRLTWDVPAGEWTVLRLGHTSTGVENAPAPASGRGLECDKLSREGIEANFAGMMARLIADVGRGAGRTLVATHIDSWENGAQNWTARMREEFQQRRGYDLLPFLPALSGRVIGSLEVSERFLWDLRQTISELVVENYAGHMQTLAHRHGLKLSIEAYGGPCEDLPYAGRADEPMCEFWIGGAGFPTPKEMASAAHIYGRPILGAEAFTADDREKWLEHPATIKALGDRAFCDGVNRFVFHRYALQPWRDRRPGMTMGPWGLHYERTQTWWEQAGPWHEYLARCQFLLRQGRFVADLCYLQPEAAPQGFMGHQRKGYDFDNCSADAVLTRMSVQDGWLAVEGGMRYRALVLPDVDTMTPALLRKVQELVRAGATVLGRRPHRSPSLAGYPECDLEVKRLADALWSESDGGNGLDLNQADAGAEGTKSADPMAHAPFPRRSKSPGRVIAGIAPEEYLARAGVPPDFSSRARLNYIHRATQDTDLYFVANPEAHDVQAVASFRVSGRRPELWWPDTGRAEPAEVFVEQAGVTRVLLKLGPSGSAFVVFRPRAPAGDPIVKVERDGKTLFSLADLGPKVVITKAEYGAPGEPQRSRDVRAQVQQRVDQGDYALPVSQLAQGGDPAEGVVKALAVEYAVGERRFAVRGKDGDTLHLTAEVPPMVVEKAVYGVPGDPQRTRDVRAKLQRILDTGEGTFQVARMAEGDDPAFLVVKTLVVEYSVAGRRLTATGTDPDFLTLTPPEETARVVEIRRRSEGGSLLEAWQPGRYDVKTARGRTQSIDIPALPAPFEVTGPWEVRFAEGGGAPARVTLDRLISWSEHSQLGVKFYSGKATYRKVVRLPSTLLGGSRRIYLDLGKVQVMASVKLNGRNLGGWWKPPFRANVTGVARTGDNTLEVDVVNLWPNRMIGDEQLPEDSARNPEGTLKEWPQWLAEGKPSPTGRSTFTSWRLWKKDAPLRESGLLGPVTFEASESRRLR